MPFHAKDFKESMQIGSLVRFFKYLFYFIYFFKFDMDTKTGFVKVAISLS